MIVLRRSLLILVALLWICAHGARGEVATFDDLGEVGADEAERVSLFLNEAYLRALQGLDPSGIERWLGDESKRTRRNMMRARGAHTADSRLLGDERWTNAARRFVNAYAREQAHLARLYVRAPSEILPYPTERAGWDLEDRSIVLSFDDGPDPATTPNLLTALREAQAPALFFVVGRRLRAARDAAAVPDYRGFTVGSHTWSHRHLPGASLDTLAHEVDSTTAEIVRAGLMSPRLFRPPYGALRLRELSFIESRGLRSILWNMDSQDWQASMQAVPGRVARRMIALALLRRHGVFLCHDVQPGTVELIPGVIRELRRLGFSLVQPYR